MAEKCSNCNQKLTRNKNGYFCPICGDYYCYECANKNQNKKSIEDESLFPYCSICEVLLKSINKMD